MPLNIDLLQTNVPNVANLRGVQDLNIQFNPSNGSQYTPENENYSSNEVPVSFVVIVEGAALASARLVGVGSASHCGGGHDK